MGTILDKKAWAGVLANAMGNTNPNDPVIKFIWAWEVHESGSAADIGCDHNPLNVADFNCVHCNIISPGFGVCKYASYDEGIAASKARLTNGAYTYIANAISGNHGDALGGSGKFDAGVIGDLEWWRIGHRTGADYYPNAILSLLGDPNLPTGGDIGQVTPVGGLPSIPGFPDITQAAIRIGYGVLGGVLLVVGLLLAIKQISGLDVNPIDLMKKIA